MAGKSSWLQKREDNVSAKGIGQLQTYWLTPGGGDRRSVVSSAASRSDVQMMERTPAFQRLDERTDRLIKWNVDVISRCLKLIIARRNTTSKSNSKSNQLIKSMATKQNNHVSFLDEVQEIITLPDFDSNCIQQEDPDTIELGEAVVHQISDYVTCIASMYRDNAFHSFEHASHGT